MGDFRKMKDGMTIEILKTIGFNRKTLSNHWDDLGIPTLGTPPHSRIVAFNQMG